jgi:hypothetical protein
MVACVRGCMCVCCCVLFHMSLQGVNTQTPPENGANANTGQHEPWQWYDKCKTRTRNKGKFILYFSIIYPRPTIYLLLRLL